MKIGNERGAIQFIAAGLILWFFVFYQIRTHYERSHAPVVTPVAVAVVK